MTYFNSFLDHLKEEEGRFGRYRGHSALSGGDINEAYRVQTDQGDFFVKLNSAAAYPEMFKKEAAGLYALRDNSTFYIPQVLAEGSHEDTAFLILEFLDSAPRRTHFWEDFAEKLVSLHRSSHQAFGWNTDNYMGKLVQANPWTKAWSDFFAEQRLLAQAKLAFDQGRLDRSLLKDLETIAQKLDHWVPQEVPALIHGDLWSGNYHVDAKGEASLIDPAVYYGHRESDLAMMQLFGGFAPEVFEHYHSLFRLEPDWRSRINLHNLYPILIHLNLFGAAYLGQLKSMIRSYR